MRGYQALAVAITALAMMAGGGGAGAAENYQVVRGWPTLPEGRVLGSATGVGVSSKGEVLVFHRAGRVWSEPLPREPLHAETVAVFDGRTGAFLREWGAGHFAMPHGLTVDGHDNVWLTDVALHQVFKFSANGKLLMVVGTRGAPGADATHFNRPTDVAVLPDGSFYVSDGYRNTRIARFSPDGRFLSQWGVPGKAPGGFDTPHAVTLDSAGHVYVADRENDRVQVFDGQGKFLRQLESPVIGRPYGLALAGDGRLLVADGGEQPRQGPDRSALVVVDLQSGAAERVGRYGNQDGQFRMAHDVAVDAAGNAYVVDIAGQRVQKFAPGPRP